MATRIASRYVSRRLSSSGKVLGEEEKAAENVYIKKMEQEKLAHKGPKPGETTVSTSGGSGSVTDAKPGDQIPSSPKASSIDKYKNYAVAAGIATIAGGTGWYLRSRKTESEPVQD